MKKKNSEHNLIHDQGELHNRWIDVPMNSKLKRLYFKSKKKNEKYCLWDVVYLYLPIFKEMFYLI